MLELLVMVIVANLALYAALGTLCGLFEGVADLWDQIKRSKRPLAPGWWRWRVLVACIVFGALGGWLTHLLLH